MPKRAIVTGAYGQDGSLMVDYLLQNTDFEVFGFVSPQVPSYGVQTYLQEAMVNPRFSIVPVDVTNENHMRQLIAYVKPDYYLNFAAQTNVVLSKEQPEETMNINALAVRHALSAVHSLNKPVRFFNAGSSEELSPAEYSPQNEDHPRQFNNPYGISKVLAHHAIEDYRQLGMFAIQPYLYNHISFRSNPSFFPKKLASFAAAYRVQQDRDRPYDPAKPLITHLKVGNVHAVRDWTAAEEVIEAIWKALNADTPKDYVIASSVGTSVKKLVEIAIAPEIQESKNWIDGPSDWYKDSFYLGNVPFIVSVPELYREEETVSLVGDSSLIQKDLGWVACKTIDQIIGEMINKEIDLLNKGS